MTYGLEVVNRGDLIIITQAATTFSATYSREDFHPGIVLRAATTDPEADLPAIYQFRSDAFGAAMRKARELGWIV